MGINPHTTDRRTILKSIGAATSVGLAGCTGGGQKTATNAAGGTETPSEYIQPGDTGNEVHIFHDYDTVQKYWEETLMPAIKNKLNLDAKLEFFGGRTSGPQRLLTLIQAGTPPETYTGVGAEIGDLMGKGQLAKVTHLIDQFTEKHGDPTVPLRTINGENYQVPHGNYCQPMTWRGDIIEELGLDPPTKSWEQWLHNAKVISESDKFDILGTAIPGTKQGQSESLFHLLLWSAGATQFKWKDKEKREVEVWFPKDEVVQALKFAKEAAQYSPAPSSMSWSKSVGYYAAGRHAQFDYLNAYATSIALSAGKKKIAKNTEIGPFPAPEDADPFSIGGPPGMDGWGLLKIADNVPGVMKIMEYLYSDAQIIADMHTQGGKSNAGRLLPPYKGIMDSDAYQNTSTFQELPKILDQMLYSRDELAPLEATAEKHAQNTPAAMFTQRFTIEAEMMNQVLVQDRDPEKVWEEGRQRIVKRLEEGKKLQEERS